MINLVFLLEELSMKEVLEVILKEILPDNVIPRFVPHKGKRDLEKSIPRKIKGMNRPDTFFVVVRDNDGADCTAIKRRIVDLCNSSGRSDVLVRIACQELETWYLGDLEAVENAYEKTGLSRLQHKAKYREPDRLTNACDEIRKLVPEFQKVNGARKISPFLNLNQNRSRSFNTFVNGVRNLSMSFGE